MDKDYKILLDALGFEPLGVDQLVTRSGLKAEAVASMLLILELEGRVESFPGGLYLRAPTEPETRPVAVCPAGGTDTEPETMKESVLDILIYLFENYVGDAEGETGMAPEPDRDTLKSELEQAGFADREIEQALAWLDSLSTSPVRNSPLPTSRSIRVFDVSECARLDLECRGYILHLENLGILNPVQREWVIDRLLALATDEIDIEQVKWVVLMVLLSQPDQAQAYAQMEDLVFEEQAEHAIH